MPLRINFNANRTRLDIEGAAKRAIAETTGQVLTDCNKYIPADQWILRDSSIINTDIPRLSSNLDEDGEKILAEAQGSDLEHGLIVWDTPYARFLYHGVVMIDPGTGSSYARDGQDKVKTDKPLDYGKQPNENACSHWCEKAQAEHGDNWRRIYEETLRRELGQS